jgi:hypothetical protein
MRRCAWRRTEQRKNAFLREAGAFAAGAIVRNNLPAAGEIRSQYSFFAAAIAAVRNSLLPNALSIVTIGDAVTARRSNEGLCHGTY